MCVKFQSLMTHSITFMSLNYNTVLKITIGSLSRQNCIRIIQKISIELLNY